MELLAAKVPGRAVGRGEIERFIRIEDDDRDGRRLYDEVANELVEGEIVGENNEEAVRSVFSELNRRMVILGRSYPFIFETTRGLGRSARIYLRNDWMEDWGSVAYLLCLWISSYRWGQILLEDGDLKKRCSDGNLFYSEYRFGALFQILASAALGGYIKGPVVSFGYPRPDKSSFLEAHRSAWARVGCYVPVKRAPVGLPNKENDAGIDLIGWIDFPDRSAGKLIVFGQVASGLNWTGKGVVDSVRSLKSWFDGPAFESFLPAMVMPFDITDARVIIERGDNLRQKVLEHEERSFGLILDRYRVAVCVSEAAALRPEIRSDIDQVDMLSVVSDWMSSAMEQIAGVQP